MTAGRMAVVVPVGPREPTRDIVDTIASIERFTGPRTSVVLVNDGARPEIAALGRRGQRAVDVVDVPGSGSGVAGGLSWLTCTGLRTAVADPDVDVLLRMDSDALVTGDGLEDRARETFAANPAIGLLGSYTHLSSGTERDFGPAAWMLGQDLTQRRRERLLWSLNLRRILWSARRHGYTDGEHVLAAAAVFSGDCVRRLSRAGLLPPAGVRSSLLPDDQFLGLAVRAVGRRFGDFATGDLPVAVAWHGLPDTPQSLVAAGKAVVHSVKTWQDQDGDTTRAWFRHRRGPSPRRTDS